MACAPATRNGVPLLDRSDVISLVAYSQIQDAFGVWRDVPTSRRVFCKADSVTQSEFFNGGQNGLKPEWRFTLFYGDYGGERTVIYNGTTYSIYRTYRAATDIMELYAERKAGVNDGTENGA